jgi:hypothetical protein
MVQLKAAAGTAVITGPNGCGTERPGNSVTNAIGGGQPMTTGLVEACGRPSSRMRHASATSFFEQKYCRANNRTGNLSQ